jgi:hypothetical protein
LCPTSAICELRLTELLELALMDELAYINPVARASRDA